MKKEALKGKVQTVLGLVDGDELGFTLMHEHLFCDLSNYVVEPSDPRERELARKTVTLENLHWARYHHLNCLDNWLPDEETAIREATLFKEAGGKTVVDVTSNNIGRNPAELVRIAQAVGINVIMGTAYYIDQSYKPEDRIDSRTDKDIADEFVEDIMTGVGGTGIRAGVIGEVGCSWPLTDNERKVLRAAAIAQQETGAVISIHPGHDEKAPFEIVEVLTDAGADPSRIIIGHISITFPMAASRARSKLAEMGCYLAYDSMGTPELQLFLYRSWLKGVPYRDMANDAQRINEIIDLIADGHLDKILISQDICFKTTLASYGGPGFTHIHEMIIPMMRAKGLTEEQIHAITVKSPKRALAFV